MLRVTNQPVQSYKVTHSQWLPLLGLGVQGKEQAAHYTGYYQHWAQGQVSKSPKTPRDLPLPVSACHLPVRLRH